MLKFNELSNASSCLNKAKMHDMIFVLLEHDVAAPHTIRAWCEERIRLGKNKPTDAQIIEARDCADYTERSHV